MELGRGWTREANKDDEERECGAPSHPPSLFLGVRSAYKSQLFRNIISSKLVWFSESVLLWFFFRTQNLSFQSTPRLPILHNYRGSHNFSKLQNPLHSSATSTSVKNKSLYQQNYSQIENKDILIITMDQSLEDIIKQNKKNKPAKSGGGGGGDRNRKSGGGGGGRGGGVGGGRRGGAQNGGARRRSDPLRRTSQGGVRKQTQERVS